MKRLDIFDPTRASLLIALAIALGILVHQVFLIIGFLIAIITLGECMFRAFEERGHRGRPVHRHP
jgi:hypothetical protein